MTVNEAGAGRIRILLATSADSQSASIELLGNDRFQICPVTSGSELKKVLLQGEFDMVVCDSACEVSKRREVRDAVRQAGSDLPCVWLVDGESTADSLEVHPRDDADCLLCTSSMFRRLAGVILDKANRSVLVGDRDPGALWQSICDHVDWGVAVVDMNSGVLQAINPAFARMHGRRITELIGGRASRLCATEGQAQFEECIHRLRQTKHESFESRQMRADGNTFQAQVCLQAFDEAPGASPRCVMSIQDTSQDGNDQDWFRSLLEAAPDAIVIIEADGRIRLANEQTQRLFGYSRHELIDQPVEILVPERLRTQHRRHRDRFSRAPGMRPMGAGLELYGLRRDGTEFPVEISLSPMKSGTGTMIMAAVRDITERKEAETALRRTERLASLGTLTAGIAHEINNPVGAALLSAETALAAMREPGHQACVEEYLINIALSMERCGKIVANILRFSRNEPSVKFTVDINDLVRSAAQLVRTYAEQQSIVLDLDLPESLPKIPVSPLEIELVLVNVIRNAVEASAERQHVLVTSRIVDGGVRLAIQDAGCGMTSEQWQHIFDPFYTTRRKSGGTGLGMSIAYGIVSDHRGTIQIESSVGTGTTIEIFLPSSEVEKR